MGSSRSFYSRPGVTTYRPALVAGLVHGSGPATLPSAFFCYERSLGRDCPSGERGVLDDSTELESRCWRREAKQEVPGMSTPLKGSKPLLMSTLTMTTPTADYEAKVESVFEMVEESDTIHPDNADLLREYRRDKELNGMSAATQQRNLSYLKIIAEHVGGTRFEEMDTTDVKALVEWVHDRDLADATVDTYKKVIRQFWMWMNDGEPPDEVSWLTISTGQSNDTLPQDLLTKEDIKQQINAAKNPRDKAFIAVLYETGARIGELIDLAVGDIEDREHGRKITIDGKTGARRLHWSSPYPTSTGG